MVSGQVFNKTFCLQETGIILNRFIKIIIVVALSSMLQGCMSWMTGQKKDKEPSVPPLLYFEKRAMEHERKNELQLALANWKIAQAMMAERIGTLAEHIGENAETHYWQGLVLMEQGRKDQATTEFLKTLKYDCLHSKALTALIDLRRARILTYTVKHGDSFSLIAEQVYQNRDHAFIVSWFSGLESERALKEGDVLTLPVLDVEFTERFFKFQKEITAARASYKSKDYQKALSSAENIIRHRPGHEEAQYIINSCYDALAVQLVKKQKYEAAIAMLEKIDPAYKNVKDRIRKIQMIQKRRREAVTENKNARYFKAGLNYYEQKKYIKALESFGKVEPHYDGLNEKVAELKQVMKTESEEYYRKGVKFFLNEELDEAIEEWQKALALDPQNDKARKDIDNAKQLLKKIDEIN